MDIDLQGKRIKNIVLWERDDMTGYTQLDIVLDDIVVSITVDNDTDELIFETKTFDNPAIQHLVEVESDFKLKLLAKTIEKRIFCYWIAKNNNGYQDLFAMGIEDVVPTLIISCAASTLAIRFAYGLEDEKY